MPLTLLVLLYLKAFKKGFLLLIILFIAGLAVRWYTCTKIVAPVLDDDGGWIYWYKWIYYPPWCRLDGLLTGAGIAALFQFRPLIKERITKCGNLLLLLSIVVLGGGYYICIEEQSFKASVFGFPLASIGYGLLVMGAISPSSFLNKFKSNITATIATFSYAIYLSHKIIIHFIQVQFSKLSIAIDSNLMFLICIIACLAGAWLINRIIEKPVFKLRNKMLLKANTPDKQL